MVVADGAAVTGGDHRAVQGAAGRYQGADRGGIPDTIPSTAAGKIQKFKLREPYWAGYERKVNGSPSTAAGVKHARWENSMSEQARSGGDEGAAPASLPYVDGRDMSPAQLRAEVAKESDPQIQHIEQVRDELAGVVDELGRRVAPRSWVSRTPPVVKAGLIVAAGVLALMLWRRRTSRHDRTT